MQSREALYIWRARYISFTIAAGGFRPALPLGNARSPNSCGRLSLNSPTRPPTKLQKGKPGKGSPRLEKKKKIGVIPYGVQGLAPSRGTGDAESLNHQIGNIFTYCVFFASISAVVGTFNPRSQDLYFILFVTYVGASAFFLFPTFIVNWVCTGGDFLRYSS